MTNIPRKHYVRGFVLRMARTIYSFAAGWVRVTNLCILFGYGVRDASLLDAIRKPGERPAGETGITPRAAVVSNLYPKDVL